MSSENTKRIAKNTAMLYFRMLFTMLVTLYTSRVILNTLGVQDYGIYNIVGGVVYLFSVLSGSIGSATQRFLSFEIGRKDFEQLRKVFSLTVTIHVILALIIFALAETIGLWFLITQINIPSERIDAAQWVYQFSVFSFVLTILQIPYNASIIAHEDMKVYAYVSFLDVSLKLLVVFILSWLSFDKLKLYAGLLFVTFFIITFVYNRYCKRKFQEWKYSFYWNKTLFDTLMSYAGWNLFGAMAVVISNQGINILLNTFFGPVVNAARGIAYQVQGAVNSFVTNFQMAVNPQIVKSYASGDKSYMMKLIFQSSKYSFFLLFLLSLPILIETETILKIWLIIVPEFTVIFCRLVIVVALIDSFSGSLIASSGATGRVKKYQMVVGTILMLNLPISYVLLKIGYVPQVTMYISIMISCVALASRLYMLKSMINISIRAFFKNVIAIVIPIVTISSILPLGVRYYMQPGWERLIFICILSIFSVFISIYSLGLQNDERLFLKEKFKKLLLKC